MPRTFEDLARALAGLGAATLSIEEPDRVARVEWQGARYRVALIPETDRVMVEMISDGFLIGSMSARELERKLL